jgi:phosphotransferase system HPr (HPr) family protein
MYLIEKKIKIKNNNFLRAHYVAEFVNKSISYKSNITIAFDKKEVNAKNIIEVMNLRLDIDNKIEIKASGEDEKTAVIELKAFVNDETKTTNN